MGFGSKWGGETGHRCFCTAAGENIGSFNVTWRKNNSGQGSFLSFYLSHTETRCYNSPTAGHPKITTGNVRLQSVRWGQERWTEHFVVHHHLPPSPPSQLHTQSDRMRTSDLQKLLLSGTKKSTLPCIHVPAGSLRTASRSIFCHAWWWTVIEQTHRQPQNSLWLTQASQGPEQPKLVQNIFLMLEAA